MATENPSHFEGGGSWSCWPADSEKEEEENMLRNMRARNVNFFLINKMNYFFFLKAKYRNNYEQNRTQK